MHDAIKSIIKKLLSKIGGESQKQRWSAYFNQLLPQKTLGYASVEEYLADNNLTSDEIIKNSINFSKPNIPDDDKSDLAVFLRPFAPISKIIIYEIDAESTPVYVDILNVLEYIKNIQEILNKFPINDNDHSGTAHRASGYKQLLKTQINKLIERLNDPYFPIEDEAAIEIIETQIKALKLVESGKFELPRSSFSSFLTPCFYI